MPSTSPTLSGTNVSRQFLAKPTQMQELLNEALYILQMLGVPFAGLSPRRLEQMAMAFLAVVNVNTSKGWLTVQDLADGRSLKTRDIISYINTYFAESISSGSYDDVRRKYLELPVLAEIVVPTKPHAARNDSTRGYALNPAFAVLLRQFGSSAWDQKVAEFRRSRIGLDQSLELARNLTMIPVTLPSGTQLLLGPGEHNVLQRAIVEQFLPRYGHGAAVLYVGDAQEKMLYVDREQLGALSFPISEHGELPDILAYAATENWLYLIEAVHSSGSISPTRLFNLRGLTATCTAKIIYVTAFLNRNTFRRFVTDIAWETEVWLADAPDHLIHFDGQRFLGPYPNEEVS